MNPSLRAYASKRWIAAGVTALCCAALLWPGRRSGGLTLSGFLSPPTDSSDFSEVIAHLFIFTLLSWLWYRALAGTIHPLRTTIIAGIFLAFGTEFAQVFVQRGVSVFDLGANIGGILITSMVVRRRN